MTDFFFLQREKGRSEGGLVGSKETSRISKRVEKEEVKAAGTRRNIFEVIFSQKIPPRTTIRYNAHSSYNVN